ncbi:DUF397 domain-containing protein [Streptomyces sp. NPDC048416]|uniref:DUF397 domain-containing protein n=1 Tax=Streptomyces sp. NPDC048416 TaxID=3365546 RepID=UPI00371FFFD4
MNEELNWRTSSHTKSDTCVEVADNDPAKVRIRDTKDRGLPGVEAGPKAWAAFIDYVRRPAF